MAKIKFVLITLLSLNILSIFSNNVEMQSDRDDNYPKYGPTSKVPIVRTDDEYITINADTLYIGARITVRDDMGDVVCEEHIDITPAPHSINISQSSACSIEVVCGKETFIGYLN